MRAVRPRSPPGSRRRPVPPPAPKRSDRARTRPALPSWLLLPFRGRLLVVGPDDLVGEVGLGRVVQDTGAAALDDEVVTALLADALDHSVELLQHLLRQRLLSPHQLALEIVGEARGVTALALELVFLLAASLGRQQRALLFQVLAQLVELDAL